MSGVWDPMPRTATSNETITRTEAVFVVAYFVAYVGYLFYAPENEALHWLSLVILPFALLAFLRHRIPGAHISDLLASAGIRREGLSSGLAIAFIAGIVLTALQFRLSRYGPEMTAMVRSGRFFVMYPVALAAMILMAATTEEVFFRGILQTRLSALMRSRVGGILLASLAFGLYHLPYAYAHPRWPSHGDWGAALIAAFGQGVPGGLILGGQFEISRRNLFSCILLHAMINAAPATTMIHFGR